MDDKKRGVIQNRRFANQVRDYSGLQFGNITPTDIDGLIEYADKGYVILEVKYRDSQMPFGQRLALERLCDDLSKVKPTVLIVASHNEEDDIDVGAALVTEYRFNGKWRPREGTTRELVMAFLGHVDNLWGN